MKTEVSFVRQGKNAGPFIESTLQWVCKKTRIIGMVLIAVCGMCIPEVRAADVSLIEAGSSWKYLDNGSNQGTAWRDAGFDDSGWSSGLARLGYGKGNEMTVVSYGPSPGNKYITTYFRHSFIVADASRFTSLALQVLRDDGVVVYLNGTEVWRNSMPTGTILHTTRASVATDPTAFIAATVSSSALVNGINVLSVEIHQIDPGSSDIGFDLQLSGVDPAVAANVTRGPYLQSGNANEVTVRWRTSVATNSRVRYGATLGNLNLVKDDAAQTTEHEVRLTGLSPGTTYYYSVGTTAAVLAGDNIGHFFLTSPPTGTSVPTRIWVLGDSGFSGTSAQSVRNAYLKFAGTAHTNLWLMLGDNAYNNGLDSEYQSAVFNMHPIILRKSVLWPTIGNHDTAGAPNSPPSLPYFNIFTLPTNAEAGGLASGTENYYSFNYGNIHFICLDSMASNRSASGPMMTWLQNDLASTTQKWVIAFWHHPPYSKGSHDSDLDEELIEMRQNALPILEAGGVDLVLSGHSHSYERSFFIDGHYGFSNTFNNAHKKDGGDGRPEGTGAYTKIPPGLSPHEGAVYAVAGSSAQTSGGVLNHPAMFVSMSVLGSMVLDVNGNRLDAKFLRSTGVVGDSFTIIKGGAAPPADPTSLVATAISSNEINLTWTDNANNEDGFKVEQSPDGISFTQVATTGPNTSTLLVPGLSPDTMYYYRVRGYNAGGDSAYTNTANASTFPLPPAAPTGLIATAISGSQINLAWTDNSNSEDGFKIEQSSDGVTFAQIGTASAGATAHSATGLTAGATYHFRVRAFNVAGDSAYSNTANATTLQTPPAAPSGLTATAISSARIDLFWADGSNNETGFKIEQSTDGVAFTEIATTGSNAIAQSITGLSPLTTYHYRVRAFNSAGDSAYSNTANATTAALSIPTSPNGLVVTVVSASNIDLRWNDRSSNEEGFKVERCRGAGCSIYFEIAQLPPNSTTFADSGLSTNTVYHYRVRAFNAAGNSSYSNGGNGKTLETPGALIVPLGSVWKYLDNGSNQGTAWRDPSFDDTAWASGPAKLGYGSTGTFATVVSYGPSPGNKYITTYFRRTFNVADASAFASLTLQVLRDDGVVVYLNGTELWRQNMPEGEIGYLTRSVIASSALQLLETTLSSSLLVTGTNVLAVEIHQTSPGSSDIAMDLQLIGLTTPLAATDPGALFRTLLAKGSSATGSLWSLPYSGSSIPGVYRIRNNYLEDVGAAHSSLPLLEDCSNEDPLHADSLAALLKIKTVLRH